MSFRINDNIKAAIYIEDMELPLDNGNALKILHIRAGVFDAVPVLHMEFVDTLKLVPKLNLNDGSQVEVHIEGAVKIVRNFRVYSWSRTPCGDGFEYSVDCYWDAPKYYMGTSLGGIRGTSYSALRDICQECGLEFSALNTETSDDMLWMPTNRAYFKFAKDIARYGYAGEKSHMVLAVDTMGVMRYRDVNANKQPIKILTLLVDNNDPNSLAIHDFAPHGRPGIANMVGGYMHMRYGQSIIDPYADPIEKLTLDSDARFPSVNVDVRGIVDRSHVTYSPIDVGNTHYSYEQAKIQNARYSLLNSMQGEFLIGWQTMFEPCDNFNYVSPAEMNNDQYDGEYTVSTKIIFIAGANYNEKIVAVKNGLNNVGR